MASNAASSWSSLPSSLIAMLRDFNTPVVRASAATFVATAAAFTVGLEIRERLRVRRLKDEITKDFESGVGTEFETSFGDSSDQFSRGVKEARPIDESLVREQLTRNYSFFGEEKMEKVRKGFIIVIGLGGVGSHAAQMLARTGVGRIRLVDFDQVTLSSLNRHAVATQADVGIPKAVCMKNHLARICPFVDVEIAVEVFNTESSSRLLAGNPDWVLDCIDNIDTKTDLIAYCYENSIPVISSMGSGTKTDPSQVQIADIGDTFEDPLARSVRRRLRVTRNIERGVPVVYSTEKPGDVKLLPLPDEIFNKLREEGGSSDDYAVLPDFRSRILPVLGTLPAMFGNAMASYVALKLADWPGFEPLPAKNRRKIYDHVYRDLRVRDDKVYDTRPTSAYINMEETGYLYDEIYRGFSVVSRSHDRTEFVRWDRRKPSTMDNIVVMSRTEADNHDKAWADAMVKGEELDLVKLYGPEVVALVEKRFAQIQREKAWR